MPDSAEASWRELARQIIGDAANKIPGKLGTTVKNLLKNYRELDKIHAELCRINPNYRQRYDEQLTEARREIRQKLHSLVAGKIS